MKAASVFLGGTVTILLMVLCLWAWQHAAALAAEREATRPYVATWAVRSGAIALAAAAQAVLLVAVLGRLYRRQLLDDVLRLSAALVFAVALVSAVALGLASR